MNGSDTSFNWKNLLLINVAIKQRETHVQHHVLHIKHVLLTNTYSRRTIIKMTNVTTFCFRNKYDSMDRQSWSTKFDWRRQRNYANYFHFAHNWTGFINLNKVQVGINRFAETVSYEEYFNTIDGWKKVEEKILQIA